MGENLCRVFAFYWFKYVLFILTLLYSVLIYHYQYVRSHHVCEEVDLSVSGNCFILFFSNIDPFTFVLFNSVSSKIL